MKLKYQSSYSFNFYFFSTVLTIASSILLFIPLDNPFSIFKMPDLRLSKFQKSVKPIMEVEGGWSNTKQDRGGKTKYGISKSVAKNHGYEVSELEKSDAIAIIKESYFPVCEHLKYPASMACLNTSVLSGPGKAEDFLNKVDPSLSPKDKAIKILNLQLDFCMNIVKKNPSQQVFEAGWRDRMEYLKRYVRDNPFWGLRQD